MGAIRILPDYTYDDYKHWEGQWELIDGIPYAMSPAPQPRHQRISVKLSTRFDLALNDCKRCSVYGPLDYVVNAGTVLQPDMLIVCEDINKAFLDFTPALVVEILSPSTASKDRLYKYDIYQQQGVRYYLIVDPETEEAEVHELKNDIYIKTASGKDFQHNFSFPEGCSATIDFKEIWT